MKTFTQQPEKEAKQPLPKNEQENKLANAEEISRVQVEAQADLKRKVPPAVNELKGVLKNKTRAQVGGEVRKVPADQAEVVAVEAEPPKAEAEDRPWRKNMKKPEDQAPGETIHNI